jgi:hypothetical protein
MTMTQANPHASIEETAREMAYSLGIAVYVRNGRIYQHPPGVRIEPRPIEVAPHGAPEEAKPKESD